MGSNTTRRRATSDLQSLTLPPIYCPARHSSPPLSHASSKPTYDVNIDPSLQGPTLTRVPQLVPASFPDDEPYIPPDIERPHSFRSLRPRTNASQGQSQRSSRREPPLLYSPNEVSASNGHAGGQPQPQPRGRAINRLLYPGYDEYGRRLGLEHAQATPPTSTGNHYLPRTHEYKSVPQPAPPQPSDLPPPPQRHQHGYSVESLLNGPTAYFGQPANDAPQSVDPALLHHPGLAGQGRPKTIHELFGLEPGVPISLDSLRDPEPGRRPEYTLPTLMKIAIYSSPKQQLSLQEIYQAIENRFEWYRNCDNPQSWKMSIRHSLSLLAVFEKRQRPITDPGKGNYWYLDFTKGEGNKRPRKRNKPVPKGRKSKYTNTNSEEDELESSSSLDDNIDPALLGGGAGRASANASNGPARHEPRPVQRKAPYTQSSVSLEAGARRQRTPCASSTTCTVTSASASAATSERDEESSSGSGSSCGSASTYSTPCTRDGSLPPAPTRDPRSGLWYPPVDDAYLRRANAAASTEARLGRTSIANGNAGASANGANASTAPAPRAPTMNGFLSHASNGAVPFGAGAQRSTSPLPFGRPRGDVELVHIGGQDGLPAARRVVRRD